MAGEQTLPARFRARPAPARASIRSHCTCVWTGTRSASLPASASMRWASSSPGYAWTHAAEQSHWMPWPRSAAAWSFSRAWAWATSRSTERRRPFRAARRSAFGWPRSSALTCRACATYSMSRPSGCIRATTRCCCERWMPSPEPATLLIVVEHDEDTIRHADHIIDLGPGAGVRGGQLVASGTAEELLHNPLSVTGRMLADLFAILALPGAP